MDRSLELALNAGPVRADRTLYEFRDKHFEGRVDTQAVSRVDPRAEYPRTTALDARDDLAPRWLLHRTPILAAGIQPPLAHRRATNQALWPRWIFDRIGKPTGLLQKQIRHAA